MAYAEDLIKLRKRMLDALTYNVIDSKSKDLYEATLIQIMNESEKQRQTCVGRAEELRRQAGISDGQANAFSQMSSIIYNVLNGYIMAAERQKKEEEIHATEMAEKEALVQKTLVKSMSESEEEVKKRRKRQ